MRIAFNNKQKEEEGICKLFINKYNIVNNKSLEYLRAGSCINKEPDCICIDWVWIEITKAFYYEDLNKEINTIYKKWFDNLKYEPKLCKVVGSWIIINSVNLNDKIWFEAILNCIKDKCWKKYNLKHLSELILLISISNLNLTSINNITNILKTNSIVIEGCIFDQIWLVDIYWDILKLFDKNMSDNWW